MIMNKSKLTLTNMFGISLGVIAGGLLEK